MISVDLRWRAVDSLPTISRGSERDTDGFQEVHKTVEARSLVPQVPCSSPQFFFPTPKLQAWCRCYLFFLTTHIDMFSKAALTFLVVGALSVNALSVPVARSPAPGPECEFTNRSISHLITI